MTMRLDAHQHFWKYSPEEYGWINDSMAVLRRDFMPADLQPLLAAEGFDGCIAVQARQSLEETRWLLELAGQSGMVKGVVGWVELCSPDAAKQLEQFGDNRKFVGVRHVVQDEPDDEFMLRPDFRRGIGLLADLGLTYDILIYPRQLPAAIKLVNEFPDQRFVVDHIAKPEVAEGRVSPWKEGIQELAKAENVWCKLSGMVTEARWNEWRQDDFRPYLDVVMKAFGPGRLMIGSDWPVCTVAGSYGRVIGIAREYVAELSTSEQDRILGGNCAEFYGVS